MSKRVSVFAAVLLSLTVVSATFAQDVSDAKVKELTRLALQMSQQPAEQSPGPVVELTIDNAVQRALENNLDLAVQRLNPQTYDYSVQSILASYGPSLASTFAEGNRVSLPNSQLTGVSGKLTTGTYNWNAGLSQNVQWGGGRYNVSFNNTRTDSSNAFSTRNPSYTPALQATYTQPLLRNFRIDGTRASLETTRLTQDISELSLKGTLASTIASVRDAYWDLLAAIRAVDVARQSMALASKLVADNRQRVEIGTMAPLDVVQAQAEEATRRQTLVQAESTQQTAELALKRLIVSGTGDDLWKATIRPVDQPTFSPQPVDIEAAVRNALENRVDLQQAQKQLQGNDVALKNLNNLTMPALDLTTTYSLSGLGGPQFDRSGLGGSISRIIPGGYLDALKNITNLEAPTWNVQLNFSYPLGTSSAKANLARARLQLQQTQAQIRQMELQVATEVTNLALQIRSNTQQVQTAGVARELAQQKLDAEESKFEVGLSTNYLVVQAQRDLTDAQITELKANLSYQKSLVDFQRAQITGTTGSVTTIGSGGGTGATTGSTTGGTSGDTTGGGGGD